MTPREPRVVGYLETGPAIAPDANVNVGLEPRDRIAVGLGRLLGEQVPTLVRACEARVFSDRTQARLAAQQRPHLHAMREHPRLRAESFQEVLDALAADLSTWPQGRAREAQTSTDFTNTLANALNRRLIVSYSETDYAERALMVPGTARDLRDQRSVGIDSPGDIPVLDVESVNYSELPRLAERSLSFAMGQRGVIASISRKIIINNDVALVQRLTDELARAARRTLARFVWTFWTDNAVYAPDSTAWFHSNHANLQTVAISETELISAIKKILSQTLPGTSEKWGARVRPGSLWLVGPVELFDTMFKLNQTQASSIFHLFGAQNENIVANPLFSDVTDWGVIRDASEAASIDVRFLNGREEPEFFVADQPLADQLFVGDRIQLKLRHEYGGAVVEYRAACKATVAG
jgi:hypothetical protein